MSDIGTYICKLRSFLNRDFTVLLFLNLILKPSKGQMGHSEYVVCATRKMFKIRYNYQIGPLFVLNSEKYLVIDVNVGFIPFFVFRFG